MAGTPIRFVPLDGVPDADARGVGEFHFDDGQVEVLEDPEMADLVKSYQNELPALEAQFAQPQALPDLRLASNDPGFALSPEQMAMTSAAPENVPPPTALEVTNRGRVDAGLAPLPASAPPGSDVVKPPAAPMSSGSSRAPQLEAPPSDAEMAAEFHRRAGAQALQGGYVQGRAAGYSPAQRTGALDPEVARRQADERGGAAANVLTETDRARQAEADSLRKQALDQAMRIEVDRAARQREFDEAQTKRQRLVAEKKKINDAKVDTSFAQGNGFRQMLGFLGSALLGATGSDAGLRMMQQNIDSYVDQQMKIRGSKLADLGDELENADQVAAGAKAQLYQLAMREAESTGKLYQAAGIEHNTPAILAGLKEKYIEQEQAHEVASMGKTVETYHEAVRGGRTGPKYGEAAKHLEAAAKLQPTDTGKSPLDGLTSAEEKDFIARVEGLADAEDSLNEIDQNVGVQRDGAGNVVNRKELGNIEGAGFFGGRTPDSFSSEKGAALSRHQRRLVQAQVKAMSGAAATDVERAEYGKNLPLADEKDFINSTTEERRRWHRNYSKAVSLYGQERVDQFMRGYRGTRGGINKQSGRAPAVEAQREVWRRDSDESTEPDMGDAEASR